MISSEELKNCLHRPTIEDLEEFKKIMYTRHKRRVFETEVWLKIQNKEDRRRRNIISDFFVLDLTNVDDPEEILRDLQNGDILQDESGKRIYTVGDFEPGLPYNCVQISPGGFQYFIWTEITK